MKKRHSSRFHRQGDTCRKLNQATILWTPAYQSYFSAGDEAEPYCSHCAYELDDDWFYCPKCGCHLNNDYDCPSDLYQRGKNGYLTRKTNDIIENEFFKFSAWRSNSLYD